VKALTLTQPWATLVAIGAKRIETRSWNTYYRGSLAIHASKKWTQEGWDLCDEDPFFSTLSQDVPGFSRIVRDDEGFKDVRTEPLVLPLGCIIAICELVDVSKIYRIGNCATVLIPPPDPELSFGDYTPDRYAWILGNIQPLPEPIPAKGSLGLWEWNDPR
jgi:hypothetical protein